MAAAALKQLWEQGGRPLRVGVALFPGYELLDCWGALEILVQCNARGLPFVGKPFAPRQVFEFLFVGDGQTPLAPDVISDLAVTDPIAAQVDMLFIPGGAVEDKQEVESPLLRWMAAAAEHATLVMSVCNGAAFLGTLGLLDGRRATTNKIDFPDLVKHFPAVHWEREARWCVDGKFHTSSGVSAGMDLATFIVSEMFGPDKAARVAQNIEYRATVDPSKDPFCDNASIDWTFRLPAEAAAKGTLRIGLVLFDDFELLDVFGPLEMFAVANRFHPGLFSLTTIAEEANVKSSKGPRFKVDVVGLSEDWAAQVDLLFVPGGAGTRRESVRPAMLQWLANAAAQADQVMTVCTGSFLLAAAGALDGIRATSNKLAFRMVERMQPAVNWVPEARWVQDGPHGRFLTSSGVAAGMDMALAIIADRVGEAQASQVALRVEYSWNQDATADEFAASNIGPDNWQARLRTDVVVGTLRGILRVRSLLGWDTRLSVLAPDM